MSRFDPKELTQKAIQGDRLSLARLITHIENRDPQREQIMDLLHPKTGKAQVLGMTGPPGAGKSTLTDQLVRHARKKDLRVAVVAIDPTSPFSGGAVLGDRIRMQEHTGDSGVFIRSLGTRGKLGGLSYATREVVLTLDAVGFDLVIVETAGVGQTELDILRLAHSVAVILVPESGDGVQVLKAGLMEIADLFVINKCDRPAADQLVKEVKNLLTLAPPEEDSWATPVLKTQAVQGEGTTEFLEAVFDHRDYLQTSGKLKQKSLDALKAQVSDILIEKISYFCDEQLGTDSNGSIVKDLEAKKLTPHQASSRILSLFKDT